MFPFFVLVEAQTCVDTAADAAFCEDQILGDPTKCDNDAAFKQTCCASCAKPRWGPFGPWSGCSKECGGGQMTRTRTCINEDAGNNLLCTNTPRAGVPGGIGKKETRNCNTKPCPSKYFALFKSLHSTIPIITCSSRQSLIIEVVS